MCSSRVLLYKQVHVSYKNYDTHDDIPVSTRQHFLWLTDPFVQVKGIVVWHVLFFRTRDGIVVLRLRDGDGQRLHVLVELSSEYRTDLLHCLFIGIVII